MDRTMKESGVEWIGNIPQNWKILRIKQIADTEKANSFIDGDWIESPDITDEGIRYLTTGNIGDGVYKNQGNGFVSLETFLRLNCKYAYPNDLIISRLNAPYGRSCLLNDEYSEYVLAVDNVILRPKKDVDKRYICYLTQCSGYQNTVMQYAKGTTMKRISRSNLGNIKLVIPPFMEQVKIADILDDKCGEIDNIILRTSDSIEEYKKYKQIIITEVTAKGLHSDVTLKYSGIEWIGNIPEHWEILPLKYVLTERNEKNDPVKTSERLSLSIDKGVTLYADKTTNLDRFKDDVTQYKLAHEGDLILNSMNMIVGAVGISNYFGCISPVYYDFYDDVKEHYTARYCDYLFKTKPIRKVLFSMGKGIMSIDRGDDRINTCRLKISRDDIRMFRIPVPSLNEQKEIVDYLDVKCAEIDNLIKKKEAFIAEMENYKKSLIYEYVTGKKNVE